MTVRQAQWFACGTAALLAACGAAPSDGAPGDAEVQSATAVTSVAMDTPSDAEVTAPVEAGVIDATSSSSTAGEDAAVEELDVEAVEVDQVADEDVPIEDEVVEDAAVSDIAVEEAPTVLRINELMAVGDAPLVEGKEERPDWIEIANISDEPVDLGDWYLSDDPNDLTRWQLPAQTLPPGDLLLVAASSLPLEGFDEALRAPFSLKAKGEFLALVEPDGETIHQGFESDYPEQRYAVSYGIDPESGEYRYLTNTTPGEPNSGPAFLGFTDDPTPDVARGFYAFPFLVTLTGEEDTVFLISLDGTVPAQNSTSLYTDPVFIGGTSFLRAVAARAGYLPSRVVTHTYVFLDDVLAQPAAPAGVPTVWQPGVNADYAVDSSVATEAELKAALRSVPTLSLVMPVDDWFDNTEDPAVGGIYANSEIARGIEWEREGSAEFFDFAHGEEAQVTAGIRIYGNASRFISRPKHNLRLVFRREYGASKLEFPLFGDDDEEESINGLLLRGQNGDSWIHPKATQRTEALYIRDQFARRLHAQMGHPEVPQGHVHLYINGLYWGLYHTIERIEDASMVRLFGGYEADWDVIKSSRKPNEMQVVAGNLDSWVALQALADAVGAEEAELSEVEAHLDLENFIDFLLVNFYNGNRDWDDNNFQAARRRTGGDRWRFFVWDSERTMLAPNDDSTIKNLPNRATRIHHNLLEVPEYRERFTERAQLHLGDGGVLSPAGVEAEFMTWVEQLREPLLGECARWGDAHQPGDPYTVAGTWQAEVDARLGTYFPARTETVLQQLSAHGL